MSFDETELETIAAQIDKGRMALAIIHTVSTIIAMLPNIFLIVVLAKYQVLNTPRNIIIMNWAIIDLLTQLSNIGKVHLLYFSITGHEAPSMVMKGTLSLFLMCHFYENSLLLVFFTDCYYKKLTVPKLQQGILYIWIVFCCFCLLMVTLSIVYESVEVCLWPYVVMLLALIGAFVVRTFIFLFTRVTRKPLHQNIRYILTSGYIATLVLYIAGLIHVDNRAFIPYLHTFMMLGYLLYPFVKVFVLYYLDNDFRQCARKLFRKNSFSDGVTYQVENEEFSHVV